MQLIHDGSKTCEYFCKGVDFLIHQSIKKDRTLTNQINANPININSLSATCGESHRLCFVATTEKESQEWLKEQINAAAKEKQMMLIVIIDYFRDSMITTKYLQGTLLRGIPQCDNLVFMMVEFFERDYILRIEDTYDHKYSYNKLTRGYKKGLKSVVQFFGQSNEATQILTKKSRRSTYANRSLVE